MQTQMAQFQPDVWKFTLKVIHLPADVVPSEEEDCDLYLMLITDEQLAMPSQPQQLCTWRIGRSGNPVQRASELQSEIKRLHGYDWYHSVVTIYRGFGDLENLMHEEFRPSLVCMRAYYSGNVDFPYEVSHVVISLMATRIERQSELVRLGALPAPSSASSSARRSALRTQPVLDEEKADRKLKRRREDLAIREQEAFLTEETTTGLIRLQMAERRAVVQLALGGNADAAKAVIARQTVG